MSQLKFHGVPCADIVCDGSHAWCTSAALDQRIRSRTVQEALAVQAASILCESFPAATWLTVSRGLEVWMEKCRFSMKASGRFW